MFFLQYPSLPPSPYLPPSFSPSLPPPSLPQNSMLEAVEAYPDTCAVLVRRFALCVRRDMGEV